MKVLIIGNGRFDNIVKKIEYDLIICADGGFNKAIENGIYPDIVIGDFDSIVKGNDFSFDDIFHNIKVIENDDQDSTDIEKALIYCLDNKYLDVTVMGVTGLRNDHFLYNLYLLTYFFRKFSSLKIIDRLQVITATDFRIDFFEKMEYLSIFSLTRAMIGQSSGLLYPINKMEIGYAGVQSQSNVVVKKDAFIEVESGEIIVFFPLKYLNNFMIKKRNNYDIGKKVL